MRPTVTVVGLGPAGEDLLGPGVAPLLAHAGAAFLRTAHHPAAAAFPGVPTFDHHYDEAATFEEVYDRIVADLVTAAQVLATDEQGVAYAVPGSPSVAERTVELLRADPRVDVVVVPALSFLDLAWARLGLDPLAAGVRLVDGTRFAERAVGERGPLLVAQCWSPAVLSDLKLVLGDAEPGDEVTVTVLHHLGLSDEVVRTVPWHELDRSFTPDHLTSVWIPCTPPSVATEMAALDTLARRLRRDCPWDREQTHASLVRYLVEETYEVVDAIDGLIEADERPEEGAGSAAQEATAATHLQEELGDLLFQVFAHSVLAAEEGRFTLADVARGVHDKLVSRHPHVFGGVEAADAATVLGNWEVLKQAEKGRTSVTDGVPMALPALSLAATLQHKARGVPGIPTAEPAALRERVVAALGALDGDPGTSPAGLDQELAGEILWEITDLIRTLGIDPEDALRRAARAWRTRIRDAEGGLQNGASPSVRP